MESHRLDRMRQALAIAEAIERHGGEIVIGPCFVRVRLASKQQEIAFTAGTTLDALEAFATWQALQP